MPIYTSQKKAQTAAFGEAITTTITQLVQIANKYAIDPANLNNLETFEATGGSADNLGNLFRCQTGTSVGGYGVVRSLDNIIYSAGQGVEARFTASFTTGVALSLQFGGMFSITDTIAFGYDGIDFGIIHEHHGKAEVQLITVTATGAGTCVVTLNGVAATGITVTSSNVQENAYEICKGLTIDAAVNVAWRFEHIDDKIYAIAKSTGDKTGTMSITGGVTANIVEKTAGVDKTKSNVAQASWNRSIAPFAGFDPTKLNVYKITYGYLGVANIEYSVYNPSTSDWVLVHSVEWSNNYNITHLRSPDLKIGWTATSLGASGTNLTVTGASASMGVQGGESDVVDTFAETNSVAGITTTFTPIMSLKNRLVYGDKFNLGKIRLLLVSISNDHTKPLIVEVIKNATLTGVPNWQFEDEFNSIATIEKAATGYTGGITVEATTIGKDGSTDLDLTKIFTQLNEEETLTIIAKTDSGTAVTTGVALTWQEKK